MKLAIREAKIFYKNSVSIIIIHIILAVLEHSWKHIYVYNIHGNVYSTLANPHTTYIHKSRTLDAEPRELETVG